MMTGMKGSVNGVRGVRYTRNGDVSQPNHKISIFPEE